MTRTPRLMSSPDSVLKSVFGFDAFRPGQKGVINCIMSEQNVLAVMPTGAGKSLCYQVPALMLEGITVVISPLVALMDNQVAALRANGVSVAIYFQRPDLVKKANLILANYYGEQLGAGSNVCNPEDLGPDFLPTLHKDLAFYPTPPNVIEAMIERAPYIKDGHRILEPNAGAGHIIEGILASHHVASNGAVPLFKCYELDNNRSEILRRKGYDVTQTDFLKVQSTPIYDLVMMNPPFTRSRDIDHVTHALNFMKPGGSLVAVMSARAAYSLDARHKAFRALLKSRTSPRGYNNEFGFHDLPELSFKSAGTNTNTVILAVTLKPSN